MQSVRALFEQQIREQLQVSEEAWDRILHPDPSQLHEPLQYKGMRELILHLHHIKTTKTKPLIIHSDYDTDGVCAATILTAALQVFGFDTRTYIPTMADGYGLSRTSVKKIRKQFGDVAAILTADNGIAAFDGIAYANMLGIPVLVTDHHPAKMDLPAASVIVDAYQPEDLYPFKGNSGACVAWKAMLAYADAFDRKKKPLIERLIVFAGLSNMADVMPVIDENRYTIVAALKIVNELQTASSYQAIADTPYPWYNTVFYGLYDLITELQAHKDAERARKGKRPVPLPKHEELFSWYLSPLLNAPRRVHDTCLEAMAVFLTTDPTRRKQIIRRLIALNEEKTTLRDQVLNALNAKPFSPVRLVNTKKGITGLIAGKEAEQSGMYSIVFSKEDPTYPYLVYEDLPKTQTLTASARSKDGYPLDRLLKELEKAAPGLVSGGGHQNAAGITIKAADYSTFCSLVSKLAPRIHAEILAGTGQETISDQTVTFVLKAGHLYAKVGEQSPVPLNEKQFANEVRETTHWLETLRPFGEGFIEKPTIRLVLDPSITQFDWNPAFWQGQAFKASLYGVEILTFDTTYAAFVKQEIANGRIVSGIGTLAINEFRGRQTPQILLSSEQNN